MGWPGVSFSDVVLPQLKVHKGVAQRPAPWSSVRIRLVRFGGILVVDGSSHALPFQAPVKRACPIISHQVPPWTRHDQPLTSIAFGRCR
jgi:hypothetical protein